MQGDAKPHRLLSLLQLNRPVSAVEECLPGVVFSAAELDGKQGARLWFYGSANQVHTSLLWSSAAFLHIALHTGANDIFPA